MKIFQAEVEALGFRPVNGVLIFLCGRSSSSHREALKIAQDGSLLNPGRTGGSCGLPSWVSSRKIAQVR
jgi:hypothetical protein